MWWLISKILWVLMGNEQTMRSLELKMKENRQIEKMPNQQTGWLAAWLTPLGWGAFKQTLLSVACLPTMSLHVKNFLLWCKRIPITKNWIQNWEFRKSSIVKKLPLYFSLERTKYYIYLPKYTLIFRILTKKLRLKFARIKWWILDYENGSPQ